MPLPPTMLEQVLEFSQDAVAIYERHADMPAPTVVFVNHAFEMMTGFERRGVLGQAPELLLGETTDASIATAIDSSLADDESVSGDTLSGESWQYRKNGESFLMSWTLNRVLGSEGDARYRVLVQRDVTEQHMLRRRSEGLERIVNLQREVVTDGLDLQRVRQKIAMAVYDVTGADAAVVEEAVGEEMVYRAVSGKAEGSLGMRLPIKDSLSGQCFRSQEILLTDDTREDTRVVYKEAAQEIGFLSGVLVPLVHQQQCYGVLKVYASRPAAFSNDDRQMLEIASDILAIALFNAASFEAEIRNRNRLVDAIPLQVSYIDRERRIQQVNAAYEDWCGLKLSEIRGKFIWEVVGETAYEIIRPHLDAALSGEEVSYEAEIPYKGAGKRPVLAHYQPKFDESGNIDGVYAIVSDLTPIKQAELDFLTGLWNRRKFQEKAEYLLAQSARYSRVVSLLLLDIDHFKRVNDNHGHLVGDEVLKGVCQYLKNNVRGVDVVGRWGGEEFLVLVPETDAAEAQQLAERIRDGIARLTFETTADISVTVSLGVAQAKGEETLEQLIKRADVALYQAKRAGRDHVAVAS